MARATFASNRTDSRGLVAERRRRGPEASAGRVLHAEKRQPILALAHLVNRNDVRMIEGGDGFRFAPETHQRLVRICLIREDALHRDDPAGVPLACAINDAHAAASDFLQDLVMTEAPFVCPARPLPRGRFEMFRVRPRLPIRVPRQENNGGKFLPPIRWWRRTFRICVESSIMIRGGVAEAG